MARAKTPKQLDISIKSMKKKLTALEKQRKRAATSAKKKPAKRKAAKRKAPKRRSKKKRR